MKKLILCVVASVVALVLGVGVVLAHAPIVTLDSIGPLYYATFPQVYDVTGQVCHSNPSNVSAVTDVTLYINNTQDGSSFNPNSGNDPCANFSLPWNITGPGTYDVKVTARHGNDIGADSEEVVVTQTQVVVTQCPAAPSIAAHYLQELNIKAGSKTFKNIISLVAQNMGPTTYFNGIAACDAGYGAAVKSFVDAKISSPVPKK